MDRGNIQYQIVRKIICLLVNPIEFGWSKIGQLIVRGYSVRQTK